MRGGGGGIGLAAASLTHGNPFHPDQCDIAIAFGERALARRPEDAQARAIVARGQLCRGLRDDDRWALAQALRALGGGPDDVYARLDIATAQASRHPLSDAAPAAVASAHAALASAVVGAGRARLAARLDAVSEHLAESRAQFLPLLRARAAEAAVGPLPRAALIDLLVLLPQSGSDGVARARDLLDAHLAAHPDAGLDTFHRAELWRGEEPPAALATRYRTAVAALCGAAASVHASECERARWRLQQMQAAGPERGG